MTSIRTAALISNVLLLTAMLFSSCATIVGGSKYNAHVKIQDHPNATIAYKDSIRGKGSATFRVKRKDANKFSLVVKDPGCDTQMHRFTHRKLRGGALFGTIIGFTGLIGFVPLPWGLGIDLATGALWKPDVSEKGVAKRNHKNYEYFINYSGCKMKELTPRADSASHPPGKPVH